MKWRTWFLLMIALTLAFLAFGYRHSLWEWWHFQVHQPISQKQYQDLGLRQPTTQGAYERLD